MGDFSIIACPRKGTEILDSEHHQKKYSKELILVDEELVKEFALDSSSSTEIRQSIKKGIYNFKIFHSNQIT